MTQLVSEDQKLLTLMWESFAWRCKEIDRLGIEFERTYKWGRRGHQTIRILRDIQEHNEMSDQIREGIRDLEIRMRWSMVSRMRIAAWPK